MTGRRYLSVLAVGFLVTALAGCTTSGIFHPYSGGKSEATLVYERAKSLYEKGQYAQAKTNFEQILTDYPDSPLAEVAMYYLASSHKEKGEYEQAISVYQQLIEKYGSGFWVDSARDDIKKIDQLKTE